MSLVIPIFVGGREGGRWFIEFPGGVVKKRESPDFRSPEVGISEVVVVLVVLDIILLLHD